MEPGRLLLDQRAVAFTFWRVSVLQYEKVTRCITVCCHVENTIGFYWHFRSNGVSFCSHEKDLERIIGAFVFNYNPLTITVVSSDRYRYLVGTVAGSECSLPGAEKSLAFLYLAKLTFITQLAFALAVAACTVTAVHVVAGVYFAKLAREAFLANTLAVCTSAVMLAGHQFAWVMLFASESFVAGGTHTFAIAAGASVFTNKLFATDARAFAARAVYYCSEYQAGKQCTQENGSELFHRLDLLELNKATIATDRD